MIGTYAPHPAGGFVVDTPAGVPLRTVFDEPRLQAMGYAPRPGLTQPGSQAIAFGDSPDGEGGAGNVPRNVSDVPMGGPGSSAGGAPGNLNQGGAVGAPADEAMTPRERMVARDEREKPKEGLRGGGEVKDLEAEPRGAMQQSSAPRYAMVPAADRRAAFSVDRSGVNPEDWKRFEQGEAGALDERKQAATDDMRRQQIEGGVQSAQMGYDARAEEVAMAARQRQADAMAADYQRRAAAIDKERAAIDSLDVKPDKLFGGATWGKAIAAISVLAGGVLAGLKGGKNQALEALNDIADRSAAEKRAEWERRSKGLVGKESDFGRLVSLYGTPQAAEAELRDRHRLLIQRWAEKRALDSNVAGAPDQLKMQFAQWDQERAAGVIDRQQKLSDHVREAWQNTPAHAVQLGGERPLSKEERGRMVQLSDGQHVFARTEGQATEVQKMLTPGSNVIAGLADLKRLASTIRGGVDITPLRLSETKMRMKTIADNLSGTLGQMLGENRLNDTILKQRMEMLGDPDVVIRGAADNAIEETARLARRQEHSIVRDYLYRDRETTTSAASPDGSGLRAEP